MSELVMNVNGNRFIVKPNSDNSGFNFYKHDGRRYAWVATIIDFGKGFSFCCIGTNGFFTKKLNKKKELVWVDRKGNPVTDDEEGQIDTITKHGNKLIARFPDVEPQQNAFLIGYHDSKTEVKLIADARVKGNNLRFIFDL